MEPTNGSSLLKDEERVRIVPPRRIFEELADKSVDAWKRLPDAVKVRGLTPDQLAALIAEARKVERVELEGRVRQRELRDARIRAHQAAYRALLRLRRMVKVEAKDDPLVKESFRFLIAALQTGRKAPAPPPAEQPSG